MNRKSIPKSWLLGGAAAAAILVGGIGLYSVFSPRAEPAAAEGGEAEQGEEGHAEDAGGGEGVVVLTPAQIQAASIAVVAVTGGGGGETRLAGRVEPMVDARAAVAASVGGRVERVLVTPGQSVRAGQPLAVLVSGDAATFRADADAAAASADAARRAYQRDQNLEEAGVVARQDVETSRAQALSAEASARAARARAAAAGSPSASGRLSVTSPINGVVTSVQVGPGGFAAQGGVIAEITNPARVEIVFNAPPALAAQVRPGAQVQVQARTASSRRW
jgi:cobalt-zinc-cadmium efflux system membrane fusion protein